MRLGRITHLRDCVQVIVSNSGNLNTETYMREFSTLLLYRKAMRTGFKPKYVF